MSELPSSEDLDPSTGTDAPTPPTTTGPSSYTLSWEEPVWLGVRVQVCGVVGRFAPLSEWLGFWAIQSGVERLSESTGEDVN